MQIYFWCFFAKICSTCWGKVNKLIWVFLHIKKIASSKETCHQLQCFHHFQLSLWGISGSESFKRHSQCCRFFKPTFSTLQVYFQCPVEEVRNVRIAIFLCWAQKLIGRHRYYRADTFTEHMNRLNLQGTSPIQESYSFRQKFLVDCTNCIVLTFLFK